MRQMSFKIRWISALALILVCFMGSHASAYVPSDTSELTHYASPSTEGAPTSADFPTTPTQPVNSKPLSAETTTKSQIRQDGDVYYWLKEASSRYGLSYSYLLSTAKCESSLNRTARRGSHIGIFQQATGYWRERVSQYNKHNPVKVSGNITSIKDNVLVSAWMMSGNASARKYNYGRHHWECRGSRVVQIRA